MTRWDALRDSVSRLLLDLCQFHNYTGSYTLFRSSLVDVSVSHTFRSRPLPLDHVNDS